MDISFEFSIDNEKFIDSEVEFNPKAQKHYAN